MVGAILSDATNSNANLEEAIFWFQKAVDDEQDVEAMLALAKLYLTKGGADNATKAIQLFEQASDAEHVLALTVLGEIYKVGHVGGIEQPDIQIARTYFERAAKKGGVYAMLCLSTLSWNQWSIHYWLYWRVIAIWTAFQIAITDPEDIRLLFVADSREINGIKLD